MPIARSWSWLAGLLIVGGLAWIFLRPQAVSVELALVERGPLRVDISAQAKTQIPELYTVSSPALGHVTRIAVEAGDAVLAGTVVASLLPNAPQLLDARSDKQAQALVASAQAVVELARADLAAADAQETFTATELARVRTLLQQKNVSKAEFDRAQFSWQQAQAQRRSAQAQLHARQSELARAQAALESRNDVNARDRIELYSPIQGRVLRVFQESEAAVVAGTPLLEIGDVSRLEVVADLLSADAVKLHGGEAVLIENWGGEQALHGQVRLVEPYGYTKFSALGIEEQRVNVWINLLDPLPSEASLGHGYRVDVAITAWEADAVLNVPLSGLFRDGHEWAVWRVEDGRAQRVRVTLGKRNRQRAQILSGLNSGDRIIVYPSPDIEEGVTVADAQDVSA